MSNDQDSTITNLPGELINANDDDFLVIDDSTDSDPLTKTKKIKKNNLVKITVKAYDATISYAVGDVVRLLDAQNFICTVATSGTSGVPEPFDPEKWTPANGDLETGMISMSMTNVTNNVAVLGNGTTSVTLTFPSDSGYQVGDGIAVTSDSGNFDEFIGGWAPVTSVTVGGTVVVYTASAVRTGADTASITHRSRVNTGLTKGFVVTDARPIVGTIATRALPLEVQPQIGYEFPNGFPDFLNEIFIDSTLNPPNFNARSDAESGPQTSYESLIVGFITGLPGDVDNYGIFATQLSPDNSYKRGLSNRLDIQIAGAKVYPGGVIFPGVDDLTLKITEGSILYPSGLFGVDPEFPDNGNFDEIDPFPFGLFIKLYQVSDNFEDIVLDLDTNTFDPNNYNPISGDGDGAAGTANVIGDEVASVTVTNGGTEEYVFPPTVVFTGGGGFGAVGTAVLTNGFVTSVIMDDVGEEYTSPPIVSFEAVHNVVPIPISGPQFQLWRMYFTAQNQAGLYYGHTLYNTLGEARALIDSDVFTESSVSKTGSFRGYIITKSGITSFDPLTEGTDWVFIPKPVEYSLDRGNPENRSGLTREILQAGIATQSTGAIDEGIISNYTIPISTISGNGAVVTVTTSIPHGEASGNFVSIDDNIDYNEEFVVITVSSPTVFSYNSTNTGATVGGDVVMLNRINIQQGSGEIADQSTANAFVVTEVEWDAEEDINLITPTNYLDNSLLYVYKDISGATIFIKTDTANPSAVDIRDKILLGVIKTRKGLTSTESAQTIWSIQNLRIALVNTRSQLDDFTQHVKYRVRDGNIISEVAPNTDLTTARSGGHLLGRGLNFSNDSNSPNVLVTAQDTLIDFFLLDRDGFIDGSEDAVVEPNPNLYDNGTGTLQAVPSNQYSVQRMWCEPESNRYAVQYGTALYSAATIEAGGTAFVTESPPPPEGLSSTAFVIASLLLKGSSTIWTPGGGTTNTIFQGDVTGGTVSGGGSGGGDPSTWSQFPATQNVDLNIKALLSTLRIDSALTPIATSDFIRLGNNEGMAWRNTTNDKNYTFKLQGANEFVMTDNAGNAIFYNLITGLVKALSTPLSLQGNAGAASPINLVLGNDISTFNTDVSFSDKILSSITEIQFTDASYFITSLFNKLEIGAPMSSSIELLLGATPQFIIDENGISAEQNTIRDVGKISFSQTTHYIQQSANSLAYEVPLTKFHEFNVSGSPVFTVSDTLIDVHNIPIVDVQNIIYDVSTLGAPHDPQNIDFNEDDKQTFTLNQALAPTTTSNRSTGKQKLLRVVATGQHTFNFNLSWNFFGDTIPDTNGDIASANGDIWEILFECWGTAETDVDVTIYKKQTPAPP